MMYRRNSRPVTTPTRADIVVEERVRVRGAEIVSHVNYSQLSRVWSKRGALATDIADKLSSYGLVRRALVHRTQWSDLFSNGG